MEALVSEQKAIFEQRVREAAYVLWQEAGSPQGQDERFWRLAERNVRAEEMEYDSALEDSFPASDPPAHSGITS